MLFNKTQFKVQISCNSDHKNEIIEVCFIFMRLEKSSLEAVIFGVVLTFLE